MVGTLYRLPIQPSPLKHTQINLALSNIPKGKIRSYIQRLLDAEDTVPEFVRAHPFETFASPSAAAANVAPRVLSAAAIEAGLLPASATATAVAATTPEMDYHGLGQARDEDEDEDDEDEIVLAPALAGLSLRHV